MTDDYESNYEVTRHKRDAAKHQESIRDLLDRVLESSKNNQDDLVQYQSTLIKNLMQSQNVSHAIDNQFFKLTSKIDSWLERMTDNLADRIVDPMCPEITPAFNHLSISALISLLFNLVFFILLLIMVFHR